MGYKAGRLIMKILTWVYRQVVELFDTWNGLSPMFKRIFLVGFWGSLLIWVLFLVRMGVEVMRLGK